MANQQSIRQDITQAENNKQFAGIWFLETAVVSILAGSMQKNWYVGGGLFLFFLVMPSAFPRLTHALALLLGASWGITGWFLGKAFFDDQGAEVVFAGFMALAGIGANMASIQWIKDAG